MAYVGRIAMRQSAQLVLFVSLTFFTGAAHAVDRGQFENIPDDVRTWFKGVRSPAGVPCCDISDGHRTEYDVRAGAYWVPINGLWWQVPEKAIIRNAGNPLGEAVDRVGLYLWHSTRVLDIAVFRRCEASQSPTGKHCNRDPYYAAKQHGADRSRLEGASQSNMNAESGKNREGRDGDTG
jgi:hypothetical protein